jgi:hypothetical protein
MVDLVCEGQSASEVVEKFLKGLLKKKKDYDHPPRSGKWSDWSGWKKTKTGGRVNTRERLSKDQGGPRNK